MQIDKDKLKPGADNVDTGINNSKNPDCKKIFTDAFGNNWYCLLNPLKISARRGISAEKAKRFMAMKLDETTLAGLLDEQIARFNSGDFVGAAAIAHELKLRQKFITEEKSILDLVFMYYFLENENVEIPHEYFRDRKHAILEADETARNFFLPIGISLATKFFNIPEEDLIKYLETIKDQSERVYRYISRPKPGNLTNK